MSSDPESTSETEDSATATNEETSGPPVEIPGAARDLRHLHRELSRTQAGLVEINARLRTLLTPETTVHRRTIADVDSQRLSESILADTGTRTPSVLPLLQRLLWFELVTGSQVPCEAADFVIWVSLATASEGAEHQTFVAGPGADLVSEAIAEAAHAVGRSSAYSFRAGDRAEAPRLGRRALDTEPELREVGDAAPGEPVDTAIVYGTDFLDRLASLLEWDQPPARIAVTALELWRDPSLTESIEQRLTDHRVATTWGPNMVLVPAVR